ncbi:MAG: hypothetical protein CL535_16570 [Ahrensia sp.]|nr:hypothetical protein [Ahrensia sp.]MBV48188.1 hypothetical protein [Roseobacter sp.]MBV48289.1 hypothetical protein [Roseobacter sp.]|tara:strand:- start:151651 stop:151986 length:336 start_codon:yes stop_codon:yes gene_type:complete
MKAFQKVLQDEYGADTKLGSPAVNIDRRRETLAAMTGGRGFCTPPMEPAVDAQGRTRGDRRRAAGAVAMAKVSEQRAPEFMHSAARRRAFPNDYPEPRPMVGILKTMKEAA